MNGVTVAPSLAGCGLGELEVRPAWDVDGVAVRVAKTQWPGHLQVAVFGLGTSLVPLGPSPASTPLAPCLLLPSPDLLVLLPPAAPFLLPIPPAARPIAIHAQAVLLTPFGFETTNANLVLAQ
jgi:hypothetical protein